MATISKTLERAIGRSVKITAGTDLVALLSKMGSEDRYFTSDITTLTNTNGLPVLATWYNFTCDDVDSGNKRVYATHATGYYYTATITNSGISKWSLEFSDNTYPVGIPIPFPGVTPPLGYSLCNGQAFDKAVYPKLAAVFANGIIPDLRGEFIRGWDNGRGADVGRSLLSSQSDAIRNITGEQSFPLPYNGKSVGSFKNNGKNANEGLYDDNTAINDALAPGGYQVYTQPGQQGSTVGYTSSSQGERIYFDASRVVPTAADNRPRNVAYNYIVRMA